MSQRTIQQSVTDFLSSNAKESLEVEQTPSDGESTEGKVPPEIARRDDLRDDVDYTQSVVVSDNGNRYHLILYGQICACPHTHGEEVPLWMAVQDGHTACGVCGPIDVRKQPDTQPATVEAFQ